MTLYYMAQVKPVVRRTYIHCGLCAVPGVHRTASSDAEQMELLVDSRQSLRLSLYQCYCQLAATLDTDLINNKHRFGKLFISDVQNYHTEHTSIEQGPITYRNKQPIGCDTQLAAQLYKQDDP